MSTPLDMTEVLGVISPGVANVEHKLGHGSARSSLEEELVRRDSMCLGPSGISSAASSIFEGNDGLFTPRLTAVAEEPEPLSLRKTKSAGNCDSPTNKSTSIAVTHDVGVPTMRYTRRDADGSLAMVSAGKQPQDAPASGPDDIFNDSLITSNPPRREAPQEPVTPNNSCKYAGNHIWDKQSEIDSAAIRHQELLPNALFERREDSLSIKDRFMTTALSYLLGQTHINNHLLPDSTIAGGNTLQSHTESADGHLTKTSLTKQQDRIWTLLKNNHPSFAKEQFRTRRGTLWDSAMCVLERQGMRPTQLTEGEFVQMVCGKDASAWAQQNISKVSRRSMEQYLRAHHLLEEAGMHPQHVSEDFMCMFEWMPPKEQQTFVDEYKQLELNMLGPKLSQPRIEADLEAAAQMLDEAIGKEASTCEVSDTSSRRRTNGTSSTSQNSEILALEGAEVVHSGVSHYDWYGVKGPVTRGIEASAPPKAAKPFGVRFTSDEPKASEKIVSAGRQSLRKKLSSAFHLGSMNLKPRRSRANLRDVTFQS